MAKKKLKPIELLRKQYQEFQQTGTVKPTKYRVATCLVCGSKSPLSGMVNIGKDKEGTDLYRHHKCEAGTASWLKHVKNSPWRKYFSADNEPGGG